MYNHLKRILKYILSDRFINKNKAFLRHIIAQFYKGSRYQCNICDFKLRRFVKTDNSLTLCPNCGSISRTRRLWSILESQIDHKSILHFSPNASLASKIKKYSTINYVTTDYSGEFMADKKLNIEAIEEPDNSYDIIICYHVLEHILDDVKAMGELYRVLKPNGICFIQTPFKNGEIYEDDSIISKEDRLAHFGQEDHVRLYSLTGLEERLRSVGFKVSAHQYKSHENDKYGLKKSETIIEAKK